MPLDTGLEWGLRDSGSEAPEMPLQPSSWETTAARNGTEKREVARQTALELI